MHKFLLSFLLVSASAAPSVALAQNEDLAVRGGERGLERGGDGREGGWRGQRPQRAAPAPQPQIQTPPPAERPEMSDRRGGWQARGPVTGGDTLNTSPPPRRWERPAGEWNNRDGQRRWENRGDDGDRRYGWNRGGTGQPASPPPIAVPSPSRQDWGDRDRDRWAERNRDKDRNRWDDRRRDGDRDRWDDNRRDRDGRRYAYRTPNGNEWYNHSWYGNNDRFDRWNQDWRRDRRYDWRGYRNYNRDYYRLPRYSSPYGYSYGYRRFSIGIILNRLFYNDRYWIDDPWAYRLPPAYGPYRWVRYYDDVLLVDLRNGRVVDAIYDFFW